MKNLNNESTIIVADLENGFVFATNEQETENYFQACLVRRQDGNGYTATIDKDDCGWNDGICGDWNESINANTENHLNKFLTLCRKNGLKVS